MKVNVTQAIVGYDGDPFESRDLVTGNHEVLTIRWAIRGALNTPLPDLPWTPETIVECARISKLVHESDDVELNEKDRTFIQDRSAKVHATAQFGPMIHAELARVLADGPALEVVPPEADDA